MENIQGIAQWIELHSQEIVENIDEESVAVYSFLKSEFLRSNVANNQLFQFVYRSFYRIDNAGLTSEFKRRYFEILEENRNEKQLDLANVIKELHGFPNLRGLNTLQFSFATKMASTIDDTFPIYDGEVARVFSLSRPIDNAGLHARIQKYIKQLDTIRTGYISIDEQNLLPIATGLFDEKFKGSELSRTKKLDFVFWSAGKKMKKEKEA